MSGATIQAGPIDLVVREPADGDQPAGALILNHGRGADERDLHAVLDELDPERRLLGVTTGAPFRGIPPGGRHWYVVERVGHPHRETFGHSYRELPARLEGLLAERGLDWSDVVLGGFSQGAVMSWALALGAGRPLPAGVVALSGFIPEVEGFEPDLESRRELPVFIHHGANDPVISPEFARRDATRLRDAGLEPVVMESDAGHWLPPEILPAARDLVAAATGAA